VTLILPRKSVVALYRAALHVLVRMETGGLALKEINKSDLREAADACERRLKGWLER
jgi:hypothetical protein